jgi:hypothetical protein
MSHRRGASPWCLAIALAISLAWSPSIPSLQGQVTLQPALEARPEERSVREQWQVIYLGEDRIGYASSREQKVQQDKQTIIQTRSEMHMTVKRFGQELKMTTLLEIDETERGGLLSFRFEMQNPPAATTLTTGRYDDGSTQPGGRQLVVETTTAGQKRVQRVPLDGEVKSPAYQDRLLRERPLQPGQTHAFTTFLPELGKVSNVRLMATGFESVKLLDGNRQKLLKVRIEQSALPTMSVVAFLDESGEPLKTDTPFLAMSMSTYTVDKTEALKAIAGTELDIAVSTLIHLEAPLRKGHQTTKAVYRVSTPGNDPASFLIADETQGIERVDANTVLLTVTKVPLPEGFKTVAVDRAYLENSQYVQSDDYEVVQHARRAAAGETNPARIAARMERYVHEKLTKKNFSTALASAAEVADSLEGDCTEHAVLLAAMLRAARIPSRIAVGLVYVERQSCFGGHMWTEAWLDGKWVPLDATLGQGGTGAAHIKLGVSSFGDEGTAPITAFLPLLQVLGSMKIELVSAE